MATKVILVFQNSSASAGPTPTIGYSGVAHSTGWTESAWIQTNDVTSITNTLRTGLALKRARLLPGTATLAYARIAHEQALNIPESKSTAKIPATRWRTSKHVHSHVSGRLSAQ